MEENITQHNEDIVKTEETVEKQKDYLFKPGQSGNPAGRPKGSISITTKVKRLLEDNPEKFQELVDKLINDSPELVWKMIDGMPKQETKVEGNMQIEWKTQEQQE